MWRRACLGNRDDEVYLSLILAAAVLDVVMPVADVDGWWTGFLTGSTVGVLALAFFRWRRRRWDGFITREATQGTAALEQLLRGNRA